MDLNHNLTGTLALVNPDLEYDPDGRQNEIGVLVDYDWQSDAVLVGFADNERALYAPDALLILLSDDDIYRNLSFRVYDATRADIDTLSEINYVLRHGSGNTHYKALEMARDNKGVHYLCLQSLEDSLELKQGPGR